MEQSYSSDFSFLSTFLQQLKQSGISSLGMMNLEPKYRWRVMNPSKIMVIPMKTISSLALLGSLVSPYKQYRQQTNGTLLKMMVKRRAIDMPPLPPTEQAQLTCTASRKNPSQIQNTIFLWQMQTRLKQTTKNIASAIPRFLLLNSLKTTLSYLRRKSKLMVMLTNAHTPTIFKLVSSLVSDSCRKMMLAATTKAATCTIIHSDRLYTDFLALKHITANTNSTVQTYTTLTNGVNSFQMGFMQALKLKVVDQNLISIFELPFKVCWSCKLVLTSTLALALNLPIISRFRKRRQVTNLALELDHSTTLPSVYKFLGKVSQRSICRMMVSFWLYLPSQSLRYKEEAGFPSFCAQKNPSAYLTPSVFSRKFTMLLILFLRSDCSLIMVSLLLMRKLLSSSNFQKPPIARFTTSCRPQRTLPSTPPASTPINTHSTTHSHSQPLRILKTSMTIGWVKYNFNNTINY